MDMLCLLPLDFLYLKLGVKPLLRLPRCLKVGRAGFPGQGLPLLSALSSPGERGASGRGLPGAGGKFPTVVGTA